MRFRAAIPLAKSHHPVKQPGKILKSQEWLSGGGISGSVKQGLVLLKGYQGCLLGHPACPVLSLPSSPKSTENAWFSLGPKINTCSLEVGAFHFCLLCLSKLDSCHKVLFFLEAFCDPSHTHPKRSPSYPIRALPACDTHLAC